MWTEWKNQKGKESNGEEHNDNTGFELRTSWEKMD